MVGFTCLFGAAVLMRMRAELAEAKVEARHAADGRRMNPWPFVIAAYAVAIALTAALLLWAFASMRRAEAAADALKRTMKPKNQRLVWSPRRWSRCSPRCCSRCGASGTAHPISTRPADIAAGKAAQGQADAPRRNGRAGIDPARRPTA